MKVICPYCGEAARLVDSSEISDGPSFGKVWACLPCDAWVGTHPNSKRFAPVGRLADASLRHWKGEAYAAFNPLWKGATRTMTRKEAYESLRVKMGIASKCAAIGLMDAKDCKRVVALFTITK